MLNTIIDNKVKVHSRDISLATYPHTEGRIIVHGILKDRRYKQIFDLTGAVVNPGIIHHMDVKLMIRPDPLTIEDAQAEMIHVPLPECRTTLDTVEKLKGLEIKAGFSRQIRSIMGGKKGCTHLCQLIIVMGQEIVQGWLTRKREENIPVPEDLNSLKEKNYLIDSCRMWTRDGQKIKNLEKAIKSRQSGK